MYHSPHMMQAKPYLLTIINMDINEEIRGPIVALLENIYKLENNTDSVAFCQKFYKQYIQTKIENSGINDNYARLYDNFREEHENRLNDLREHIIMQKRATAIFISLIIISTIMFVIIKQNKKKLNKQKEQIDSIIADNEFRNSFIEGKIKSKNAELRKKEEQIKSQQIETAELKRGLENKKDNLKEYCQSEICVKILGEVNELSMSHRDTSELHPLSKEEFVLLLQSANMHIGNFLKDISNKYPSLKKEDLYYICLLIINLNDKQIASLFGLSYEAIRKRIIKIMSILKIDIKESLHKSIMESL